MQVGRLVKSLVAESECVIMDLSGMSENILWEVNFLRTSGAVHKTIFLVQDDQLKEVGNQWQDLFRSEFTPPLLGYDLKGLKVNGSLIEAITTLLSRSPV